jgi:hypothetical protein
MRQTERGMLRGRLAVRQSAGHLRAGQLGTVDVTASTVANIGPGIDFYFAFGVIAVTAGVVVPFVELCKPGQPSPYSEFPYIALGIVAPA